MTSNEVPPPVMDDDEDIFATPTAFSNKPSNPEVKPNDPFLDVGADVEIDLNEDTPQDIGGGKLTFDRDGTDTPPMVDQRMSLDDSDEQAVPPSSILTPAAAQLDLNQAHSHSNGASSDRGSPDAVVPESKQAPSAVLNPASLNLTTNGLHERSSSPTDPPSSGHSSAKSSNASASKPVEALPEYDVEVSVTEYERRGEGMSVYVVFKVVTVPRNVPVFSQSRYEVWRRFSDFLGVHKKLHDKHAHLGRIVPCPPEKSTMGNARTKMSEEENQLLSDFLERRRSRLERFVRRVAKHPVLLTDVDFRDFVTLDAALPKANDTSALSGAGIKRMFKNVGEALNKITIKIDESDRWFEEKQTEVDVLYETLEKLQVSSDALVHFRREMASSTEQYAKSLSLLAACEENTSLARTIAQLAETQEKVSLLQRDQAEKDFYLMADMLRDYLSLLGAVRNAFYERTKVWQKWQDAEVALNRKREAKTRFELAGKSDKVPQAKFECEEAMKAYREKAERKVKDGEVEFGKVSDLIRQEMVHFDAQRIKDFKASFARYLESLALTQQQLIKYWDAFLPEAKAIIT